MFLNFISFSAFDHLLPSPPLPSSSLLSSSLSFPSLPFLPLLFLTPFSSSFLFLPIFPFPSIFFSFLPSLPSPPLSFPPLSFPYLIFPPLFFPFLTLLSFPPFLYLILFVSLLSLPLFPSLLFPICPFLTPLSHVLFFPPLPSPPLLGFHSPPFLFSSFLFLHSHLS